ncbi:HNH endonuclease [Streptomyces fractus]|uniref:HNH endonuclease n=1 Tax=Streptomyces fractus TaxID=641806 RepID=UPI003CF99DEA
MPNNRPAIPRELARSILVEAGHRCAIPTCRATTLEIAHITPWRQVRQHEFENLIALCPNCHTRFDKGEIDRKAMLQYKVNLRLFPLDTVEESGFLQHSRTLDAYRYFQSARESWEISIRTIASHDCTAGYEASDYAARRELVARCSDLGAGANRALVMLQDSDCFYAAREVFEWMLSWANDVVDGLWPSTYGGATPHDDADLSTLESDLHAAVCHALGTTDGELPQKNFTPSDTPPLKLGGTGKRF